MGWSGCERIDHPDREIEYQRENARLRSRIAELERHNALLRHLASAVEVMRQEHGLPSLSVARALDAARKGGAIK